MENQISLYGNVALQRIECPRCGDWSFVIDGMTVCCREKPVGEPKRYKRMTNPEFRRSKPSAEQQRRLLDKFDHCCAYCERAFGSYIFRKGREKQITLHWDHQIPYAYSQNSDDGNFLPACNFCNGFKSDKVFRDIEEVKLYVALKWQQEQSAVDKMS